MRLSIFRIVIFILRVTSTAASWTRCIMSQLWLLQIMCDYVIILSVIFGLLLTFMHYYVRCFLLFHNKVEIAPLAVCFMVYFAYHHFHRGYSIFLSHVKCERLLPWEYVQMWTLIAQNFSSLGNSGAFNQYERVAISLMFRHRLMCSAESCEFCWNVRFSLISQNSICVATGIWF